MHDPIVVPPLPRRVAVLYAAGGLADSIKTVASGLYLLFFYTTVLGLPSRFVGAAAALTLVWDAVIDPVIGRLSDGTRGSFGRRHGWMLAGSLGMAAGFAALFMPPPGAPRTGLVLWLLAVSLVLRTSQSMFTVPYMALGAELAPSYDGRTTVASYRAAAAQVGAVIASGVSLTYFFAEGERTGTRLSLETYGQMGLWLGALLGAAGLVATLGTWGRRHPVTPGTSGRADRRPAAAWGTIVRHRALLLLTCSAACFFMGGIVNAALAMYFVTTYAGLTGGATLAACQFALHGGAIAGVPCWWALAQRYEKHRLHLAACLTTGLLVASAFWIARAGGPFAGAVETLLIIGYVVAGASGAGAMILPSSMLADLVAEHEAATGTRAEGVFFGAFSCGQQVAAGLSAVLAALLVDYFAGLQPGVAQQAPDTVVRIGVLATLVPGALMALGAAWIAPYHLTRARVADAERTRVETSAAV